MTRRYSSISIATTLAAPITDTQTTLTVVTGTGATLLGGQTLRPAVDGVYPDQFTLAIDPDTNKEEIVFAVQLSSDTFTIVRGRAGSSAIAHSSGATVKHVLTSNDLDYFRNGTETADAAISKTIVDSKGDLVVGTASDTVSRLAVGTNGQVLKADSTTATGLAWGTDLGKILQVVEGTTTSSASGSSFGTFFDTNLTATITPSSASSKIVVLVNQNGIYLSPGSSAGSVNMILLRGSTSIAATPYGLTNYGGNSQIGQCLSLSRFDTPATTSAVTYKTQLAPSGATGTTVGAQYLGERSTMILMEVAG